jgi:alpha-1,3-mannosyl-glycoprotein beta-1,2-N-acetylglucosaminyltransferase
MVRWPEINLSKLQESVYDQSYFSLISNAQSVKSLDEALSACLTQDARLEYRTLNEFKSLANKLRIMNDEKAGIPRTAYRGVVEIRPHGNFLLFLIPPFATLKSTFLDPHQHA